MFKTININFLLINTRILRNEEGQVALESANDYCNQWQKELRMNKLRYLKYKKELNTWKQKIYYALAKYYTTHKNRIKINNLI